MNELPHQNCMINGYSGYPEFGNFSTDKDLFFLSDELHREKGSDGPESVESVENRPGRVGSACCQA